MVLDLRGEQKSWFPVANKTRRYNQDKRRESMERESQGGCREKDNASKKAFL